MKRSAIWLILAALVSLVLILASCGPGAATTTAPTTAATTAPATTTAPPTTKPAADKPKYGGIYTSAITADTALWDATQGFDLLGFQISLTNEPLLAGDWSRGPAGTGETDWQYGQVGDSTMAAGQLAESWEIPDNEHLIFKIRKGIKWWNKPPANGRELVAADIVWNIKIQWANPGGNFQSFFSAPERLISVEEVDKYTVKLTVPPNTQGIHYWEDGIRCYMMLPELYPKQTDWKQALGTGAFMVKDYVPASTIAMERNPTYWQKDPAGPGKGNQLPYLDGIKFLVIPELSTRLVAFRTGKIDMMPAIAWEDWEDLQKTVGYKFEYVQTFGANFLPTGRQDKDLPFKDVRVRQAMNLAVDKVGILRDYYKGHGDILGWPYYNTPAYKDLLIPLDQLPANVQELVKGGNPEKAKTLLKEAGYPNGFKTNIVSSTTEQTDFLSILKGQLGKVGIDLEIKVVEPGVFRSIERGRTWEQMWYKATKQYFLPHYMFELRPEANDSAAFFDSPQTRAVYNNINKSMAINDKAWRKELKDITPFMLEQSIAIWLPVSYKYTVWQPWLKNFYGATTLGAFLPSHNTYFNWIDTDLKKSMGR